MAGLRGTPPEGAMQVAQSPHGPWRYVDVYNGGWRYYRMFERRWSNRHHSWMAGWSPPIRTDPQAARGPSWPGLPNRDTLL